MMLFHEYVVLPAVPSAGPVLVSPAEAERDIGLVCLEHALNGHLKHPLPREPVIIEAEAVYAVSLCKLRLLYHHLFGAQVVEAQVGGYVRLIMPFEVRLCLGDICPLGKTLSPPEVIFGYRVELGQIECDEPDI